VDLSAEPARSGPPDERAEFAVYMGSDGMVLDALQAELSSLRQEARGPTGVKRSLALRLDGYPAALRGPLG
jgi:hypothetical protein